MQIIVMGMHRSGTSIAARLLNMMGAYFSHENNAMPPTTANPKGYWEREDIRQLNDQILSSLSMSWDNISDLQPEHVALELHPQFTEEARRIVFNLDAHRPWMIKDPRLCLTLPLWKPLLEVPVIVYVYRKPIQIAQSLHTREQFSTMVGIALWEKYTLYALHNLKDLPKVLIAHADLMTQPVATVKQFHQDLLNLEVQGLRLPSEKEICAFLDPQLYRQRGDLKVQSNYLNSQQALLVEAFENKSIFQLNALPNLSVLSQEILQEYKHKLVKAQEIVHLHQQLTQQHQQQQTYQVTLAIERERMLAEHAQALATKDQLLVEKDQLFEEKDQVIQKVLEDYGQLQQALNLIKQAKATENINHKSQITRYQNELFSAEQTILSLKQTVDEFASRQTRLQEQLTEQKTQYDQALANQDSIFSTQFQKQRQSLQQLLHWVNALQEDIDAIFKSLTWRSGNIVTQIMLRLLFKKPGPTARDHIQTIQAQLNYLKPQLLGGESSMPTVTLSSEALPEAPKKPTISLQAHYDPRNYPLWIQKYDTLSKKMIRSIQQQIENWAYQPLISIVMPTYNTQEKWLRQAIESVRNQLYPKWELCIADDASTEPHVRQILESYVERDGRIKLAFRDSNGHISAASNTALELVTGEFVTFLDHDDLLAPHALFWVAWDILDYPEGMLWYSDEDKVNEQGERYDPYFKSDWNPDLFLSHNLITHLAVYRTSLVQKVRGFREGFEGAQDYDLALRAIDQISPLYIRHIPRILYHWRAITGSTAVRPGEKPYAIIAAQQAITEYLGRRNVEVTVTESPDIPGTIRVRYHLPVYLPLVTLIIPTRNAVELLRRAVESIYEKTDYPNFEILIINNQSDDPATLNYFQQLEDSHRATIIDYPHPFHYADMNNMAVTHAQGELIGLLNNDLEVINKEWLSEMVSHALRPEIGVVGARLWYPNNTLQHGGVILGIGGVAGHSHKGLPRGDAGYFGRAGLIQNFSAVTGACMLMRKSLFLKVEGLDAENLSTAFNDVDLCLKMNQHNLRILWTPYAELYHHESATRGYEDTPEKAARFEKERTYMKGRWPQFLMADPAYSPNLTLETQDFAYAWPPRVSAIM